VKIAVKNATVTPIINSKLMEGPPHVYKDISFKYSLSTIKMKRHGEIKYVKNGSEVTISGKL